MSVLLPFIPGLAELLGLAAILLVATGFLGLGRFLDGKAMPVDTLLVSGWGAAVLSATVLGVATSLPLVWILFPAIGLGLVVVFARHRDFADALRLLAVGLPLLLVVAAASASQWDEFAHWLVNQRYLFDVGTFPRQGLPESRTIFAAYPYGLPLVGFAASRLAGFFIENAGALFNSTLILVLGSAAIRAFSGDKAEPLSWPAAAAGVAAATLLNPTFVPKLVFTTYADWPTAVVLGVALINAAAMSDALARDDNLARRLALQIGLTLAALVSLKQPNAVLALLLVGAIGVLAALEPSFRLRHLGLAAWIIAPPVLTYLMWRYHVTQHLPGREFSFLPWADWLWDDLGSLLLRMMLIASKKGGYFGLMIVATTVAIVAVVRRLRGGSFTPLGRIAILVGTIFVGYNVFLYVAYIGAFGAGEGQYAASYWRYNTQLGGAGLIFGAAALGVAVRRFGPQRPSPRWAGPAIVAIVALVPLLLAPKIRFDRNPVTRYMRDVGREMESIVQPNAAVTVIDPDDNGKRALILRYETAGSARIERVTDTRLADPQTAQTFFSKVDTRYVWINVPTPVLEGAVKLRLAPLSSHLLERSGTGWHLVRSWPYRGFTDPVESDD